MMKPAILVFVFAVCASDPIRAGVAAPLNYDQMEQAATAICVAELLSTQKSADGKLAPIPATAQLQCLRTLKGTELQGKTLSISYQFGLRNTPSPNWQTGGTYLVFMKNSEDAANTLELVDKGHSVQAASKNAPAVPANASSREKIERECIAVISSADEQDARKALEFLLSMDSKLLRAEVTTLQKSAKGLLVPMLERAELTLRVRDGDVSALKEIKSLRPVENDSLGHVNTAKLVLSRAVEKFTGKDGSATLCDLLDHADESMRRSAAYALRASADDSAIPALLSHLVDDCTFMSPEFHVSYNCMAALFRLSNNKHQPSVDLYKSKQKEYNDKLRAWALTTDAQK